MLKKATHRSSFISVLEATKCQPMCQRILSDLEAKKYRDIKICHKPEP